VRVVAQEVLAVAAVVVVEPVVSVPAPGCL
jgi:hypothetical protein